MPFQPKPFGKYYLLEPIATGGMAEIFKAKTIAEVAGFEKLLAIKRILPHLSQNSDFITMLIDEAKIAVQLNHMNIAQVFDLGKVDNDYFIAMEFIHGRDLRSILRRCEEMKIRMSVENAVYIILEVCKGLDYAHRKKDQFGRSSGIVHRDVSPQNILISYEGLVKIVDFGIAKAARKATETEAGVLKGKFAYMSPEQARGLEVDQRTDIFSAGIILYELLKNERLFHTDNNMKTLEMIRNFHIEPPFLPADVPSELEYILIQALANDPNERYQWANEFQVDLTKFLYSSALDFTSKNLSELMALLFKEEMESPSKDAEEEDPVDLDTQTRMMIAGANQEVLVSRPEDMTPAQLAARMAQPKSRMPKGRIPTPAELFEDAKKEKRKGKGVRSLVILAVLAVMLFFFQGMIKDLWQKFTSKRGEPATAVSAPATTPAPPEVAAVQESSVYVETDPPGAKVSLDQVDQNQLTPIMIKNVAARQEHVLVISAPNFAPVRRVVKTESGEILKIRETLTREVGSLFMGSDPGDADIYINDVKVGKTPLEIGNLAANVDLGVALRKEHFQDYFEVVRLQGKQTKILQAKLVPVSGIFGTVKIVSVPPGAHVFLDGKELPERTPTVISKLEADRTHALVLRYDGYLDYADSFRVNDGATHAINAYLKAKPEEIR